jgi:hypothetical protein
MIDDDDLSDGETIQQMQIYSGLYSSPEDRVNLFDYTEYKLRSFEKNLRDKQQKNALSEVIKKYKEGYIAVGWRGGSPMWTVLRRD